MQLPKDILHKRGTESTLYTLLQRHNAVCRKYEALLQEAQILSERAAQLGKELLAANRDRHAKTAALLSNFSGSPVKPNTDMLIDADRVKAPKNIREEKLVFAYFRDLEEDTRKVYAELAKGDHFPDMVSEFLTSQQQNIIDSINALDFKAKAR